MGRVTFEALLNSRDAVASFSTIESRKTVASHRGKEIQRTLIGVQAFLDFNPNSLQVVTVVMGTSSPLGTLLANRFDNSVGTLDIAAGTLGSGTNGQCELAVVTMSGGASGVTTPVVFSSASPRASAVSVEGDHIQ